MNHETRSDANASGFRGPAFVGVRLPNPKIARFEYEGERLGGDPARDHKGLWPSFPFVR